MSKGWKICMLRARRIKRTTQSDFCRFFIRSVLCRITDPFSVVVLLLSISHSSWWRWHIDYPHAESLYTVHTTLCLPQLLSRTFLLVVRVPCTHWMGGYSNACTKRSCGIFRRFKCATCMCIRSNIYLSGFQSAGFFLSPSSFHHFSFEICAHFVRFSLEHGLFYRWLRW